MNTNVMKRVTFGVVAGLSLIDIAAAQDGNVGRLQLRIANEACAAVSKEWSNSLNPNPSDINDGDLDNAETMAIEEGCVFRVIATDASGMRVPGVSVELRRSEAPVGTFFRFGNPRTTDAQGVATWRFQPTPNTDFIYDIRDIAGGQPQVTSNSVEIQLCTGNDSVGAIPGAPVNDAGMGCQNNRTGQQDQLGTNPEPNGGNDFVDDTNSPSNRSFDPDLTGTPQ